MGGTRSEIGLMKVEIIFPTIERWHCIDLILRNLKLAEKPEDIQVLSIISGSDKYADYVTEGLKSIFKKVRIVRKNEEGIEHNEIRQDWGKNNRLKLQQVYTTYELAIKNVDRTADFYWFIEDDTLFPLNIFGKFKTLLDVLDGDIITGISYYWPGDKIARNFWNIKVDRVFPKGDSCNETTFTLLKNDLIKQEKGVVQLGASGLGNVLAKRKTVLTWSPKSYANIGSGADISFYYNAKLKGYTVYGVWNIFLPHITIFHDGSIEIRGRIDKSLFPVVFRNEA